MAPPRATKKPSHTSATESATRQGPKKSREQHIRHDEDMEELEDVEEMDMNDDDQDEQSPNDPVEDLVSNMVEAVSTSRLLSRPTSFCGHCIFHTICSVLTSSSKGTQASHSQKAKHHQILQQRRQIGRRVNHYTLR
jgi:hypothetical protein